MNVTIRRLARNLAVGLGALMLACIVAFVAWREIGQLRVAAARRIDTPDGIDVLEKVRIGGTDQWISIRGRHLGNPVLLYLHGGPGFPMMPFAHTFQTPWEDSFTVVQWDQRGTGKTYRANDPAQVRATITFERMLQDAHDVTQYLRKRLGKQKVILLAHSWGTMIGIPLVKRHPELFYAYVGTGQVINVQDNERVGYEHALAVARERHNAQAVAELEALAPYPDPKKGTSAPRLVLRKWQRELGLSSVGKSDREILVEMLSAGLRSPDYTLADNLVWLQRKDSRMSRDALAVEIDKFDLRALGYEFELPVVFLLGKRDWQVPSVIAEEYLQHVEAPYKRLVWFDRSAHTPPYEQPEEFHSALVEYVLPLAQGAGPQAPDAGPAGTER